MGGYTYIMDEQLYKRMLPPPAPDIVVSEPIEPSLTSTTGGRPSKFNAERVDTLVKWLKLGYYIEEACHYGGNCHSRYVLCNWVSKGGMRGSARISPTFRTLVKKARAEAEGCTHHEHT